MSTKKKRVFGIFLVLAMALGLMLAMSQAAYAAEYWEEDKHFTTDEEFDDYVQIENSIKLTIDKGATVKINGGADIYGTLIVKGEGKLIIKGPNPEPYSGYTDPGDVGFLGNILIDGPEVTITGGKGGDAGDPSPESGEPGGIGGAGVMGNVTIKSGSVTVNGGKGGLGDEEYPGGGDAIMGNLIVKGGSAIVTGGEGGYDVNSDSVGVSGDVIVKKGETTISGKFRAVRGKIIGTDAQESWNNIEWNTVSENESKCNYVKVTSDDPVVEYPLWVGGVQVTNYNQDDVLDDDPVNCGKVSFTPATTGDNPTPATLALNGYTYSGEGHSYYEETIPMYLYSAIQYDGQDPLTVLLKGENSLTCTGEYSLDKVHFGIRSKGSVTIDGTGSIAVNSLETGIQIGNGDARNDLDIEGGSVSVNIENGVPIEVFGNIVIGEKAGTVNVESSGKTNTSVSIYGEKGLIANGGDVQIAAYGEKGKAVNVTAGSFITIGKDVKSFTAIGGNCVFAAEDIVKNAIPGIGWTNVEGTEGKTAIAESETGQDLSSYKKVRFLFHTHSFTYEADGATITAICANTDGCCPLPEVGGKPTATLIIGAPTMTYYGQTGDGISPDAVITDKNSIQGDAKVLYYKATKDGETYAKDGDALSSAPTDAGDYVAEITLGVQNASHATASVGYTIDKANSTVTADPQGKDITESGEPQEFVTDGTVEGGEMQYALGEDAKTAPEEGWSKDIPKETNAGTYYVWYKVVGDSNHKDTAPKCVTAKIKPVKTVTVNTSTVTAKALSDAVESAGGSSKYVTNFVIGSKVKKICKNAFKKYKKVKTLTIKTKKLKKAKVKQSLKGSKITKIKVKVGKKKANKKYVKKYKKIFTKKNAGKKAKVTL